MLMYANPRYVNLLRVTMLTAPQDDIPNKNLKVFKGYPDLICCMCFLSLLVTGTNMAGNPCHTP